MFVSYLCVAANSSRLIFVWMCALGPWSCSDGNAIWRGTRAVALPSMPQLTRPSHCPNANLLHPWTWPAWWEPQGIITLSEQIRIETLSFPVKRRGCATRHFLPSTISEISPGPCQIKCRLELMISQATFVLSFSCFWQFWGMMWTFLCRTQVCVLVSFSGNQLWIISSWPNGLKPLHHWNPQRKKKTFNGSVCQVRVGKQKSIPIL